MMGANRVPPEIETVSIHVPQEDVGRLIGKSGAQIKLMREQCDCQINIDTNKQNPPVVHLKGTPQAIAAARRSIAAICGGDGITFYRDIDENTLAHLTRDGWLQQKAAEFGVTTELSYRHLKITATNGQSETAESFRDVVEKRVAFQSENIEKTILCSSEVLKKIKEDQGIKQLESIQHLKLSVTKAECGTILCLRGQRPVVEEALECVEMIIKNTEGQNNRDFIFLVTTLCDDEPSQKIEDLKSDIKEGIELKYNVRVHWTLGAAKVIIEGDAENVSAAKTEFELMLQYYFNEKCAIISIPISSISTILGPNDTNLVKLQSLELALSVDKEKGSLWICGTPRAAENAYNKFTKLIDQWNELNYEMPLKEGRQAGIILGPRGDTIRKLQNQTEATISIDNTKNGVQVVRIRGTTPDIVQSAKKEILSLLSQSENDRRNFGVDYSSKPVNHQRKATTAQHQQRHRC